MKFIELFAGIGGFRYGLESIGVQKKQGGEANKEEEHEGWSGLHSLSKEDSRSTVRRANELPDGITYERQFNCVYSNEWDEYANSVYRRHYGECDNRDITTVRASELPDFDLLTGGVPCQAWSLAGKRGGFGDERGNLWFEFFRILKEKQPKYFIAENVKGILSSNKGRAFEEICEHLCECGYAIDFDVLNSKDFGVPQNRERVFIVGVRLDLLDECQVF